MMNCHPPRISTCYVSADETLVSDHDLSNDEKPLSIDHESNTDFD